MIVEISIAVIAVAFVLLVIFLVRTLITARRLTLQLTQKLEIVEKDWLLFSHHGEKILESVRYKLQILDGPFQVIQTLSDRVHQWGAEKQANPEKEQEKKKIQKLALELLELVGACASLIRTCKEGGHHGSEYTE